MALPNFRQTGSPGPMRKKKLLLFKFIQKNHCLNMFFMKQLSVERSFVRYTFVISIKYLMLYFAECYGVKIIRLHNQSTIMPLASVATLARS